MVGVNQQVSRARGCYQSGTAARRNSPAPAQLASPVFGVVLPLVPRLTGIQQQGVTMDIRKARYYAIGHRPISLVYVECISDEHPELLDAPEADEMVLESEGAVDQAEKFDPRGSGEQVAKV